MAFTLDPSIESPLSLTHSFTCDEKQIKQSREWNLFHSLPSIHQAFFRLLPSRFVLHILHMISFRKNYVMQIRINLANIQSKMQSHYIILSFLTVFSSYPSVSRRCNMEENVKNILSSLGRKSDDAIFSFYSGKFPAFLKLWSIETDSFERANLCSNYSAPSLLELSLPNNRFINILFAQNCALIN